MSQTKKDRSFPLKPQAISDEELAKIVASALHEDFGHSASAVKLVGQLTNANLRAIKNWFQAKNAPSSGHLMLLARSSPTILAFILQQIGGSDLCDAFQLFSDPTSRPETTQMAPIFTDIYRDKNVPIKKLNERQRWFLMHLKSKKSACADDIANHFDVAVRTAKRDLENLKAQSLISFVGSKKRGVYSVRE